MVKKITLIQYHTFILIQYHARLINKLLKN
jgi:hypothetical protein